MASSLQTQHETQSGVYTFSSRPRAVPNRPKYRQAAPPLGPVNIRNEEQSSYGNIMYDRRVVRGNTYAQPILPIVKMYLEELSDHIEDVSVECQTDMFLDKPATPLFIPAKTGRDAATQIEEGELFDFDVEVQPVLQVLVGKTIEQALLEVLEEEELANLRAQQQVFKEIRDAELVEVQRLEERERRLRVEKENRIKQQKAVLEKEKETADKIAARAFAQQYLSDLLPSVYSNLKDCGYFYDPVQRGNLLSSERTFIISAPDIETGFLPWLMEEVTSTLEQRYVARTVLDSEFNCFLRYIYIYICSVIHNMGLIYQICCCLVLIQDVTNQRLEAFEMKE
ncbi:hypothetical protein cypCar_00029517 [Cyprinus carpio]|nr:hypothetical protein cypCar_00029517 [Cyprinus carpio]